MLQLLTPLKTHAPRWAEPAAPPNFRSKALDCYNFAASFPSHLGARQREPAGDLSHCKNSGDASVKIL